MIDVMAKIIDNAKQQVARYKETKEYVVVTAKLEAEVAESKAIADKIKALEGSIKDIISAKP